MKILRDDEVPRPPAVNEHRETDWAGLATGLVMKNNELWHGCLRVGRGNWLTVAVCTGEDSSFPI